MDNYLSSEFGNLKLSSTAREWRPSGAQQQQQSQQEPNSFEHQQPPEQQHQQPVQSLPNEWQQQRGETELNISVKEFVPGHGWNSQVSSESNAINDGEKFIKLN